jgi:hypothetical protein
VRRWKEIIMKMPSKSLFAVGMVVLSVGAVAAPANAVAKAVSPPAPSAAGGVVTVCPGVRLNLDDPSGKPLPIAEQKSSINALSYRCDHPGQSSSVISAPAGAESRGATPDASIGKNGGEVLMHIQVAPGDLRLSASANSMSYGTHRTLSCDYSIGGGTYQSCGRASGPGTYLLTRTDEFCPVPGKRVDGIAEIAWGSVAYYDDASAITQ